MRTSFDLVTNTADFTFYSEEATGLFDESFDAIVEALELQQKSATTPTTVCSLSGNNSSHLFVFLARILRWGSLDKRLALVSASVTF